MATILVVDDRAINRQLLVTLLGYSGHRLFEASDGIEALVLVQAEHPDLVITDILMPNMDGFEFVQHLRADPAFATTEVIFYTATYRVPEAAALAEACGVRYVITKPAEPQQILEIVSKALGTTNPFSPDSQELSTVAQGSAPEPLAKISERLSIALNELGQVNHQLSLLSTQQSHQDTPNEKLDPLVTKFSTELASVQKLSLRLAAIIELGFDLSMGREPLHMLDLLCHAGRKIIEGRLAAVCILTEDKNSLQYFAKSANDAALTAQFFAPPIDQGVIEQVISERRPIRQQHSELARSVLPPGSSLADSLLAVPIVSMDEVTGVLYFMSSLGADHFTTEDEWMALILAGEIAQLLENTRLYDQIQHHAAKLQLEVAERRQVQEQLSQINHTLETLIRAAPVAIQTVDADAKTQIWNPKAEQLFGWSQADVIGEPSPLIPPHEWREIEKQIQSAEADNAPTGIEIRPRTKQGFPIDVSLAAASLRDAQGAVFGSLAMFVDITERKKQLAAIELLQEISGAANQAHSQQQAFQLIVDRFCAHTGWPIGHVYWVQRGTQTLDSMGIWHLDSPEEFESFRTATHTMRLSLQTETILTRVAKSGAPEWVLDFARNPQYLRARAAAECGLRTLLAFPALVGQTVVAVFEFYSRELVAIDPFLLNVLLPIANQIGHVVERERVQEQDRLATVGQLAAGIAHDFNNMLTPIILFTDLTSTRLPRNSKEWSNLQEVIRSASRAKDLILQILSFSQPTSQPRDAIHLQAIIREVTTLLRGVLPANIELRLHVDAKVGQVLADTIKIHQILMNLCINASHAMRPQGGILAITLDQVNVDGDFITRYAELKAGNYVRLTVADTGHGMDVATIQRIFDPFFTTKAAGEGTGMGLSVVHGIVKSYEGAVTVDSEVGKGTTFRIYLPHASTTSTSSEHGERSLTRGSERILIVDDEISIATATQAILEGLGYVVTAINNSLEALHLFRQSPDAFDLVITDLTMPGLSGAQLIGEITRTRPDIPIILVSGTTEALNPERVRSTGVRAYLMKPFSAHDISRAIRDIFDADDAPSADQPPAP